MILNNTNETKETGNKMIDLIQAEKARTVFR